MSCLRLDGDIDADMAALFVEQLSQTTQDDLPLTIDLSDAEIMDGKACAALIDAIRQAAARWGGLQLIEPPQVIAHGLYRVGALPEQGPIHLVSPREEIGTSS